MKWLSLNIRLPPFFYALVLFQFIIVSCDQEWPDDICTCHKNGNVIGGWEDADTTDVHRKDSTGGFAIQVENWNDTIKSNIFL